jgi:hypothetical protein
MFALVVRIGPTRARASVCYSTVGYSRGPSADDVVAKKSTTIPAAAARMHAPDDIIQLCLFINLYGYEFIKRDTLLFEGF